jgi:hypothetical protein
MYKRSHCFLIENNILAGEQFGFREKSTTDMATYELLDNIQLSLDKKKKGFWVAYSMICKRHLIV